MMTKKKNRRSSRGKKQHIKKVLLKTIKPEDLEKANMLYLEAKKSSVESKKKDIEIGHLFNGIKEYIKPGYFEKVKEEQTLLDKKYIERSMLLARSFDFEMYEALYYPPRYDLHNIITKARSEKISPMELLENSNIDLDIDVTNDESLKDSLQKIKALAKKDSKSKDRKTASQETEKQRESEPEAQAPESDNKSNIKVNPKSFRKWLRKTHDRFVEEKKIITPGGAKSLENLIKKIQLFLDECGA